MVKGAITMRNTFLGAAGAALIALGVLSGAQAADMAPMKAVPYVAAPQPSWSGWIISGVVGGDWNNFNTSNLFAIGPGGAGTLGSYSPSDVAFGVKSELIYMFNPVFGVEHKLLVRYGNPTVNGTSVPYWRGDSFANIVIAINNQWAVDAGVGIAAQTLKFNVFGAGVTDPTYGWAFDGGLKWKPSLGTLPIVAGLDFVYEDMNGLAVASATTKNTNFGVFGSLGVELQ
jgi:hypothetical protein